MPHRFKLQRRGGKLVAVPKNAAAKRAQKRLERAMKRARKQDEKFLKMLKGAK